MSKRVWTGSRLVHGMAALGLGVAMSTALDAGARGFDRVAGHVVRTAEFSDDNPIGTETDPTENGSTIIECVALRDNFDINPARARNSSLVAMPQHPLGPSKCWPREHKRT
jgi:hypothetical protein